MKKAFFLFIAASAILTSVAQAKVSKQFVCSADYTVGGETDQYNVYLSVVDNAVVELSLEGGAYGRSYTEKSPEGFAVNDMMKYSILLDDRDDTYLWFDVYLKDNKIVKKVFDISGNDSDNYYGSGKDDNDGGFVCVEE